MSVLGTSCAHPLTSLNRLCIFDKLAKRMIDRQRRCLTINREKGGPAEDAGAICGLVQEVPCHLQCPAAPIVPLRVNLCGDLCYQPGR